SAPTISTSSTTSSQPTTTTTAPVVEQRREQKDSHSSTDGWMLVFTALLVGVGAGQVYVVWRQNTIMHNQTAMMSGQLTAAAKNAEAAILATRAYITLEHRKTGLRLGLYTVRAQGKPSRISASITMCADNHGDTPGRITYRLVHWMIDREPLHPEPPYDRQF